MTYNTNDSDGAQALHFNQLLDRYQFSVASGCDVSINSGTLGQADTLTVAAGEVIFNGSPVSVSSQSVQIAAANQGNPRKDVVYLDATGTAQIAQGAPEAAEPSTATRFETFRPAPLDLSGTDAVVVAEVWVPAGASSITSSDLRDRRVLSDLAVSSINTDVFSVKSEVAQTGLNGHVVPIADGLGVDDAYDVATTTNPVNAAVDDVRLAGGGDVLVPPGTTQQNTELPDMEGVTVRGYGRNATTLEFTQTGTTAHAVDLELNDDHGSLENIHLKGPGSAQTTGAAVHFSDQTRDFGLDNVVITGWGGPGIESNGKPYEMDWGHVHIQDCSGGSVVNFQDLGPSNSWRQAKINGNGTADQMVYEHRVGGQMHIQTANIGGNVQGDSTLTDCAALIIPGAGGTVIDTWNYEPATNGASTMFDLRQGGQNRLTSVWHHTGTLDYIYTLENPGVSHTFLGKPRIGGGTLTNTEINVVQAPSEKILYEGVSGDVTNATGTNNVRCLADGVDA